MKKVRINNGNAVYDGDVLKTGFCTISNDDDAQLWSDMKMLEIIEDTVTQDTKSSPEIETDTNTDDNKNKKGGK